MCYLSKEGALTMEEKGAGQPITGTGKSNFKLTTSLCVLDDFVSSQCGQIQARILSSIWSMSNKDKPATVKSWKKQILFLFYLASEGFGTTKAITKKIILKKDLIEILFRDF